MLNRKLRSAGGLLSLIGMLTFSGCEDASNDFDSHADEPVSTNQTAKTPASRTSHQEKDSPELKDTDPSDVPTGIIPQTGKYSFSARGYFTVTSSNSLSFSQDGYAHYSMPIRNGAFRFRNGYILGDKRKSDSRNMYPTDGFDISGNFTSEISAQGRISYSSSGRTYEGPISFTAIKDL